MSFGGVGAVFARELKLAWSGGGGAALPVGFFAGSASLTPLALGPEPDLLKAAGPGIIWIAMALSSLLPMERLFQADLEDGTLDAYAGSGTALEGIAAAKTAAHWVATGLPLALIAPVLWIMLQGPVAAAARRRAYFGHRLDRLLLFRRHRRGAGGGRPARRPADRAGLPAALFADDDLRRRRHVPRRQRRRLGLRPDAHRRRRPLRRRALAIRVGGCIAGGDRLRLDALRCSGGAAICRPFRRRARRP